MQEDVEEMVPAERIELPTFGLQNRCTTAVLRRLDRSRRRRAGAAPDGLAQGFSGTSAGRRPQALRFPKM